jgi:hypothetical protein
MLLRIVALLGAAACGACLPVHQTQYLPQAADAAYSRDDSCDNADNTAHFSFHGVGISAAIWSRSRHGVHVAYEVPAGVAARLATTRAVLTTHDKGGTRRLDLSMSRMQFKRAVAAIDPMPGQTSIHRYLFGLHTTVSSARYEFRAEPWDIDLGDAGSLLLPDLLINSRLYPGPVINYRRSREFGWVHIGC